MPLTRPKASQIDFSVTNISDPLIRLNSAESGSADKDTGIVMERGSDGNVALIYDESEDQFALINTNETGTTSGNITISSYADLTLKRITQSEQQYTTSNMMKFNQYYLGNAIGSYLDPNEYQKVLTITPASDNENYQVSGRIMAQNAGDIHIVYFTAALRSGTRPDLSWSVTYSEEYNGSRYIDPQLWTKESTTAGFIIAFKGLIRIFGTITVDIDVIPRSASLKSNVVMNTAESSEQTTIDTGFTANDMTKVSTLSGTNLTIAGSLTASSLAYPTSDGTANQVIQTDGSGTLSFADASGGAFTAESDGASLTDTTTGSAAGPVITLTRNASDTAADGNYLGQLKFKGDNDAGSSQVFAKITGKIDDASDGTEDGLLEFANKKAGSNVITARLTSTELKLINGTGLEVAGLTYPTADGSAGQQLTTDGSGVLSWADSGSSGSVGRTLFNYAITGTTTTLTGTDANSATLAYTAGQLDVFVNGVRMAPADITATNGTSIVFGDALVNGDVVDIVAYTVIDISQIGTGRTLFNYAISGTPTTVTGADSNGNTLAYTVGQIDVFVNGVRMAPVDITATNGTSVVFGSALANSDVVDIVTYTAFDVVTNDASDLTSGTVPTARVAGAYTGITSTGTLTGLTTSGSINLSTVNTFITGGGHNVVQVDSTKTYLYGGTGGVQFRTADNASPLVDITNSGKIGIGESSPTEMLHIKDDGNSDAFGGLIIKANNGSANVKYGWRGLDGSDQLRFATGGTERMRIDSSGNVGIGTTSPTSGLEVSGKGLAVGSGCTASGTVGSMAVGHASSATGDHSFVFGREMTVSADYGFGIALSDQNGLNLTSANTMAIVGGAVGIGTIDTGNALVRVEGATGGNAVMQVENTATSGNVTAYLAQFASNGGTVNSAFFQGNIIGSANYYLLGNGTHTFTSDERLKKNIETTRDGYLEDLAKLRVVKYNWKHHQDGDDKELGLIAQEVEKVFPKLVQDDLNPISEDDDTTYKILKQSVLPFMLLKAIQELSAKNDALEARIATQATQIADLISRVTALENG